MGKRLNALLFCMAISGSAILASAAQPSENGTAESKPVEHELTARQQLVNEITSIEAARNECISSFNRDAADFGEAQLAYQRQMKIFELSVLESRLKYFEQTGDSENAELIRTQLYKLSHPTTSQDLKSDHEQTLSEGQAQPETAAKGANK